MALLDFLKKKKEAEKGKKSQKKAEKPSVAKESKKETKPATEVKVAKTAKPTAAGKFSYDSIQEPHISEKASLLAEKNQYTFKVYSNFNKPEIKKSIEGIYGVNVLDVNVIKIPRKKRRMGKTEGFKKGYNKAVVTIKAGQKIEIL